MAILFVAFFVAVCASVAFYACGQKESDLSQSSTRQQTVLVEPFLLPIYLIVVFLLAPFLARIKGAETFLLSTFLLLLVYICVYYAVLLCILPLLRRAFSARACATLWLLPNFLYLLVSFRILNDTPPLFTLTLPQRWLGMIGLVWAAGFALVLLGQIVSHFRYRRFLLRDAEPVRDRVILSQWENDQKRRNAKRMIPVLVSDRARTPLTIGCSPQTMRLVLPHLNYTREEFRLIFQHEMRHIQRADTRTKASLGFYTALCWFNPLMWVARRKVADDLELSCDELVLTLADEPTRKQYAHLLLDTAGSSRGYTTCLSAAASSLRYRLKNIVKPHRRLSGSILVGLVLFALILGSNTIALADSASTVQTAIFDKAPAGTVIDRISINNWDGKPSYSKVYGWEEAALTAYIASLPVKQIYSGSYDAYDLDENLRQFYVDYAEMEDGKFQSLTRFEICDGFLWVNIPYDDYGEIVFRLEEELDWDYLESLLDFDVENPDPTPYPPDMMMYFDNGGSVDGEPMYAAKNVLRMVSGGEEQKIDEALNSAGVGGVFGFPVTQVQLSFSYEPVDGCYAVRVENWDRTGAYSVFSEELTDGILELAPYSAHYTVYGTFETVGDTTYEMKFAFDVKLPEE